MQIEQAELILKLIEDTAFPKAAKEILSIAKKISQTGQSDDLERSDKFAEFAEKLYQSERPYRLTVDLEKKINSVSAKIDKTYESFIKSLEAVFNYFNSFEQISEGSEHRHPAFRNNKSNDSHKELEKFFTDFIDGNPPINSEWPNIINMMKKQIEFYHKLPKKEHASPLITSRITHIKKGEYFRYIELKNLSKLHIAHIETLKKDLNTTDKLTQERQNLYIQVGLNSNISYPLMWDFQDLAGLKSTRPHRIWDF